MLSWNILRAFIPKTNKDSGKASDETLQSCAEVRNKDFSHSPAISHFNFYQY